MRRPWQIWLAFAGCLALCAAALAWLSIAALRSERAEAQARAQTALEENARLALWRMDSVMTLLVAQESATPPAAYAALPPAPAETPLAENKSPQVVVHFQFDSAGRLTSPEVPRSGGKSPPPPLPPEATPARAALDRVGKLAATTDIASLLPSAPVVVKQQPLVIPEREPFAQVQQAGQQLEQQAVRADNEFQARRNYVQQNAFNASVVGNNDESNRRLAADGVRAQAMTPLWVEGELLLARRVVVGGELLVQGCLVDWPTTREQLLASVRDLLPEASLRPASSPDGSSARLLAAVPVELVPGPAPAAEGAASPIVLALTLAWGALVLAAVAAAVLLGGVLVLSERRAAFVSAVTHELRTPLTTFRMYAEMLSGGMVPEADRRTYLRTLSAEADRLMHLVENVLSYARLERGRPSPATAAVAVGELLNRGAADRLASRAREAGLDLRLEAREETLGFRAQADPHAVEQVLLNLVDNACKYAAGADERTLHLEVEADARRVLLGVRDHGPGVPASEWQRLFRPFHKSARDAAHSAPGVGLGLALSRRLARDMGGELSVETPAQGGARFVLVLRAADN